jgi:hypothetical protein
MYRLLCAFLCLVLILLSAATYIYCTYCRDEGRKEKVRACHIYLTTCIVAIGNYESEHGALPMEISHSLLTRYADPLADPYDPFMPDQVLRYRQISEGQIVVYSVGPDRRDQRGEIEYDPSNGAYSPGDITRHLSIGGD